ncbi:hypothetical protein SCG7109_AY_00010 [Chlamydiales bacterium SCGC AG-110-M15]|nr:hypothetical protein SCG7109_AY_00010 [Chlamydiales bacterium SCGC AG-110-M15]
MSSLAGFVAGFAFFLVGLKLFATNLNQLTSNRFRILMTQFTPNGFMAGMWGIVLSLLTAGNTVLTPCISAGFQSVNAINIRKAIQIVIWSRVGACFFIYLAGFNIKVLVLLMMGFAGISFAINKPRHYSTMTSSIFHLGLVLYGIQLIKSSTKVLIKLQWFETIVDYTQLYPEISFIAGFIFLMVAQSLFGTLVIALSFIDSGIFQFDQALMFMYGSYLGEGVLKIFYLAAFKGIFRQMMGLLPVIYFCTFGVGLFTYVLDDILGIPFLQELAHILSDSHKLELAHVNLLVHLCSAILLSVLIVRVESFIARWGDEEEDHGETIREVDIPDEILDDPVTTLEIMYREEMRMVRYFPMYMEHMRTGDSLKDPLLQKNLHTQVSRNLEIIRTTYSDLLNRSHYHRDLSARILQGIERHNLAMSLEENLYQFSIIIDKLREGTRSSAELTQKFLNFVEAMDATILSMIDVLDSPKETFYVDVLRQITSGRDDFLKEVREHYEEELSVQDRVYLIKVVNLFESSIWMIKKIGSVIDEELELEEIEQAREP